MKQPNKITPDLKTSQSHGAMKVKIDNAFKVGSDCICKYNLSTNQLELSDNFNEKFGFNILSPTQNWEHYEAHIHREDRQRIKQELSLALQEPSSEIVIRHYRLLTSTGKYAHIEEKLIFLRDEPHLVNRILGLVKDVSHEHFYEQLDALATGVLELSMVPEAGIELVIAHYLLGIEQLFPGLKASVLWVKDNCIWNLVSPSLDPGYIAAIDGQKIGLNRGSCGTAAYLKERIIVSDVFSDPRWASFRDLAKQYQIASCWTQPIFNKRGEVIATFALYYQEARNPDEREIEAIDRSKSLLAILLTNYLHVQNILENKERYEYLNKATNDAIYDWDLQANQIVWGESFMRLFGYGVENPLINTAQVWEEIIIPTDFIQYKESFTEFLAQKDQVKWELNYRVLHDNGAIRHVKEIGYLIRSQNGKGLRMIGVLRDITEQVQHNQLSQIQSELAETFKAENLLPNILDNVLCNLCNFGFFQTAEIWLTSLDSTHTNLISTYAKDNISRRYFECSKEIRVLNKGEGIPGLVWSKRQEVLFNDIQSNPLFVRKEAVKEADLVSAFGLPLIHGRELVGVLMFCSRHFILEDQSELNVLKQLGDFLGAEIKRKQQEEEMFLLFESAPEMMAITSPNGYFTKVNPAFCKVLGYSAEEIEYKPFVQFLHPEDVSNTLQEFDETKTGERTADNFVNRYITKSGENKWISWSSSDVFGEDGFVFAFGRDISSQIEFQRSLIDLNQQLEIHAKELAISNKELEQFAYIASHDLQEPLRMVSSFLTQLEKKYGNSLDEKAHQYIHFAVDGAKRMRQIILDLLDYSRIGKNEGEPELISLNKVIEEVLALQRKTIEEKCAQFVIEQMPNITAFRVPILQVFHNIIGNAIKYAKENDSPIVEIKAIQKDKFIEIAIQDNGIGIEQEYFDKIFIIFQRLHNNEKYGGTGMGLAIVKKIMENMGGAVRVESTPGKGSTFYLLLPIN